MKRLLTLGFYLLSQFAFSQGGTLEGYVKTSDGTPAEFVAISISGQNKGEVTDIKGYYSIGNIEPGRYEIVAFLAGLEKLSSTVEIKSGKVTTLNFTLKEGVKTYDEVVVTGNFRNKYHKSKNDVVAKLPLKQIENPQVYQSLPKELFTDQVATTLEEGLKNATGVTQLWESTGRGGDGAAYYTMRGFSVQPTLVNGVPGLTSAAVDPANIESVEVIKGPSATLFGSPVISYGGLINITTKRPYDNFGGSVGYVSGNFGLNRLVMDVNNPLSDKASLRLVGAYHKQNSFQNAGMSESFFFAPSFSFKASDKWEFIINTEIRQSESVNAPMLFLNRNVPLTNNSIDLFESNYRNSFTSNDLSIKNPSYGIQAQSIYQISDNWKSQTIFSTGYTGTDGYYHYLFDLSGDANEFTRFISYRNGETNTMDIQQNFIGDFNIGSMRNRMVVGLDYFRSVVSNSSSGWVANGAVTLSSQQDTGDLTSAGVDQLLAGTFAGNTAAESEAASAYISNVLNVTNNLSLMASLRVDRFSGSTAYWTTDEVEEQVALSPKFGIVYEIIKDKFSVFGNYMNGFSNVAPREVADADGSNPRVKIFDPEQANQYEFGTKANIYKQRVFLTASYYDIQVTNRLMQDPDNINNTIQGGKVGSRGVEFSLTANPLNGLNLIAGYSFNESEVLEDDPANGYLGFRPEEAGPAQLINYWASYTIPSGKLSGFGLGFGGNAASEHKTLNRSTTGTFAIPAYHIVNASLFYQTRTVTINLKINNLANERYFSGWSTVTPQQLRSVSVGLNYRF